MKKTVSLLLIVCTLLSTVACGGEKPEKKPSVSANITAYATHTYNKIIANIKPKGKLSTDYTVYMTRGETEGCQIVIYSDQAAKKVELVTVSGENESITTEFFSMNNTHKISGKQYTDSTFPYGKKDISLEKNKSLSFVIDFKTTADTPAGEYKYVFAINDASKKKSVTLATYNVTVHVWDIVLPEEKTFATSAGINTYHIGRFYGGCGPALYKQFYDMLLEHNVCAHSLPYDILDPRADEYMSDPRVTSFVVPSHPDENSEEDIIAYYNKLKENPVWLKKAIFYPIDEPANEEELAKYREHCERLKRLAPEIPVISPIYTNIQMGEGKDQVDFMDPTTDLWCPKLCLWDDSQSYDPFLDYKPSKSFAERMAEMQSEGDKMWSYVCNDPIDPYAQLFINTAGVEQRLMMWQHYQRNIEGFLYWGTTSWGYRQKGQVTYNNIDPWETTFNGVRDGNGSPVYGEGFLFYPAGLDMRMFEPVSSIRMKILRDGIDDIEFFYVAEKALGKEWVMNYVDQATPTLTSYVTNEQFAKIRIEMGNAVEAALKNK
ncbi:MAG: DUF4091 domain-containing protein [Ruminococcaceae bacterium]|nr:DUF4091 domain-containing protein [Oscillospiraceae bacterium]